MQRHKNQLNYAYVIEVHSENVDIENIKDQKFIYITFIFYTQKIIPLMGLYLSQNQGDKKLQCTPQ